jgi:hypothetical protein
MNCYNKFNPVKMANKTGDVDAAKEYSNWPNVCRMLDQRGFNVWEAEAILLSEWTKLAFVKWNKPTKPTATALANFLDDNNFTPNCSAVNELVMNTFGNEFCLELNSDGIPCRRGNVVVGGASILVPLGTPSSCDPTQELYWSM